MINKLFFFSTCSLAHSTFIYLAEHLSLCLRQGSLEVAIKIVSAARARLPVHKWPPCSPFKLTVKVRGCFSAFGRDRFSLSHLFPSYYILFLLFLSGDWKRYPWITSCSLVNQWLELCRGWNMAFVNVTLVCLTDITSRQSLPRKGFAKEDIYSCSHFLGILIIHDQKFQINLM